MRLVEFLDEFDVVSHGAPDFSFRAPNEDERLMPSDEEDSAQLGLPHSKGVRSN